MTKQFDVFVARLGDRVKTRAKDSATALCPAHDDSSPSLSVSSDPEKGVLWYCHAGCGQQQVMDALGLNWSEVMSENELTEHRDKPVGFYLYDTAEGEPHLRVTRFVPKRFKMERWDGARYVGTITDPQTLKKAPRTPYRFKELTEGLKNPKTIVWITEGEKDADIVRQHLSFKRLTLGKSPAPHVVTTYMGGQGKFTEDFLRPFEGSTQQINIISDNDGPGRSGATKLWKALVDQRMGTEAHLTKKASEDAQIFVRSPLPDFKDISEQLDAGVPLFRLRLLDATVQRTEDFDKLGIIGWVDMAKSQIAPYDWVVPGLIEAEDTVMMTGWEGGGKSTLLRQIAACASLGIDPFSPMDVSRRYTPKRAFLVDVENGTRLLQRKFLEMTQMIESFGHSPVNEMFTIYSEPEGIDLRNDEVLETISEKVAAVAPDLLVIGPLYQLHMSDPNKEEVAQSLTKALRKLQVRHQCAILIEAHAPHGDRGKRVGRPAGSSAFVRWAQYGMCIESSIEDATGTMAPTAMLTRWRNGRDARTWPTLIQRGSPGAWYWTTTEPRSRFGYPGY